DGYTVQEKLPIARDHLVRRQLDRNGLDGEEVSLTDDAILAITEGHTREAGVRGLERQIGKLLRKVAAKIDSNELTAPVIIDREDVRTYLGRSPFHPEDAERTDTPGLATGLAVTRAGRDVRLIEPTGLAGEL